MMRPRQMGTFFVICLGIVFMAMAWISVRAVQLDRAESYARHQAALEERVRLALWRMDSNLAPLIAQESARPYFCYSAFYPAERAYTRMYAEIKPDEIRLPSPLLTSIAPQVLVHFQLEPDGRISSPQVPGGKMRELAESGYTTHEQINRAELHLARLQSVLDRGLLRSALPLGPATQTAAGSTEASGNASLQPRLERTRTSIEELKRLTAFEHAAGSRWTSPQACEICPDVKQGMMRPMWIGDTLVLARKVSVNQQEYVQGCQLDWMGVRRALIADIADLLPEADLRPIGRGHGLQPTRLLAALPAELLPGPTPQVAHGAPSSLNMTLAIAWGGLLLGAAAVGALLCGMVSLNERRATFVSAVTHELRTPLTTLRMYAEMLSGPMLRDEDQRREYLSTLRAEAERLGHLVDNVLSFSRLEHRGRPDRLNTLKVDALLGEIVPRLERRAAHGGLQLRCEGAGDGVAIRGDRSSVEQILLNLVDNACKYGQSTANPVITLCCERNADHVEFRVRDYGQGLSAESVRSLFRPFSKSARDAAESAPGVGLGLALSRRLAWEMNGDLKLDAAITPGACFVLRLPVAATLPAQPTPAVRASQVG